MKSLILIFLSLSIIHGIKDIGKLNLVNVQLPDVSYKKLMVQDNGILSAPPLVILDTIKLKSYKCFKNIRSDRWSLGVPIMFWNKTYMNMIHRNISSIEFFKKFQANTSVLVLPPCGILAYRLNWRRRYELFDESLIKLDSFWYNSASDYVLPKYHTFIMEFKPSNDTEGSCKDIQRKLLEEHLQSQELTVDFIVRRERKQSIPPIKVTIGNVRKTKMYNDTSCESKAKCYVSFEYAEKWAFEISTNILRDFGMIHLSLQKDIYDGVLNNYLCKDKIPISELETIKKLKSLNNELGCTIPGKVYTAVRDMCTTHSVYKGYHQGYINEVRCTKQTVNYDHEIVMQMSQGLISDEKNEFTMPVKRY